MSNPFVLSLLLLLSLLVLVVASDFFTNAAEKIGLSMGLSPFIVGVTIVSIGTSLPELMSSIIAVLQGSPEVVAGNVVGSNIANIFLIIGAAGVISAKTIRINYDLVSVDLPLFVGSAFLLALTAWDNLFTPGEAWLFVVGYIMYLFYTVKGSESNQQEDNSEGEQHNSTATANRDTTFVLRQGLIVILSSIFIFIGARFTIDSLIGISKALNIGVEIIAITAVALGTSLPELVVTINASLKGKAEIAVGNVLGSNIFNVFMVMGIPGLVGKLTIPETILHGGIPMLIAGTLLLFFTTQDKKLTIWEGWLFLMFYVWFIGRTFELL
ncbi:MAG: calcium/sodium antiporter [Leptolyngbyaceae cyanobacterium MO_188.B28]|nr:calcium/sodium antiporter [Leptolyngbyaceae cyanobacterium MO_188.B28]